jgi:hypothetical protein
MDTTQQEWDKLLNAANGGDGFAIDHIVEGRLRGSLPPSLRDAYEAQCFLMWSRDGDYTADLKKAAAAHDPSEPVAFRDDDVSVLDVRFVDASSACSFLGLSLEGDFDISISFHPRSTKPIRVLLREESGADGADDDPDVLERSKMWESSGYKVLREWTPRSRVSFRRTSFDGRPPPKAQNDNFKGRSVVYTIRTLSARMQGKSNKGADSDLDVRLGIREPMPEADDSSLVLKVTTIARISPRQEKGGTSVRAVSSVRITTSAGACSLVDCDTGSHQVGIFERLGNAVYCNWIFGGHTFECGRTAVVPLTSPAESEFCANSFWLLASKGSRSMHLESNNEVSDASEVDKRGLKAKLSRIFSDDKSAKPTLYSQKRLEIYLQGNAAFIDRLERQGVLRRIRKNNTSWNKTQADNLKTRRASLVASARF